MEKPRLTNGEVLIGLVGIVFLIMLGLTVLEFSFDEKNNVDWIIFSVASLILLGVVYLAWFIHSRYPKRSFKVLKSKLQSGVEELNRRLDPGQLDPLDEDLHWSHIADTDLG